MKKLILMLTVATISMSAMAQTADNTKNADGNTSKMQKHEKARGAKSSLKDLNLTDDQKQQMKTLNNNFRQQMKDLKSNESIAVSEQKERRLALLKQYQSDRNKLLTDEQKTKLQATDRKHDQKGTASADGSTKASKQLNLTEDQRAKIKSIGQSYKTKIAAVQKNDALSSEQKKDQVNALQKQHREEMSTVLTDEQKEQLKESKKHRKGQKDA